MNYFLCDLHIHTALSACAAREMDPPNIVRRCINAGLQAVAITDHNSAQNTRAVSLAARGTGLLVVPGIEAQTSEEIHMVLLFSSCDQAEEFEANVLRPALPRVRNRPKVFGEQLLFDAAGRVTGVEQTLLGNSLMMSVNELIGFAEAYRAVVVAAHADRPMYGYLYTLGFVVPGAEPHCYEFNSSASAEAAVKRWCMAGKRYIVSSDAHALHSIVPGRTALRLSELEISEILSCLRDGDKERVVVLGDEESQ